MTENKLFCVESSLPLLRTRNAVDVAPVERTSQGTIGLIPAPIFVAFISPLTSSFSAGLEVPIPTFPEASPNTDLLAGNVQNTSLVPAEKSTAESELELLMIVVLANVSGVASVTVPNPTSNSFAD